MSLYLSSVYGPVRMGDQLYTRKTKRTSSAVTELVTGDDPVRVVTAVLYKV
jgi:hypothetical protein